MRWSSNPSEREPADKTYAQASAHSMGGVVAEMFAGMVANGMTRAEALEVVKIYVAALASRPDTKPKDE